MYETARGHSEAKAGHQNADPEELAAAVQHPDQRGRPAVPLQPFADWRGELCPRAGLHHLGGGHDEGGCEDRRPGSAPVPDAHSGPPGPAVAAAGAGTAGAGADDAAAAAGSAARTREFSIKNSGKWGKFCLLAFFVGFVGWTGRDETTTMTKMVNCECVVCVIKMKVGNVTEKK